MAHSRDVTMSLNEITLRSGCSITKKIALFVYCFRSDRVKKNIQDKVSIMCSLRRWENPSLGLRAANC